MKEVTALFIVGIIILSFFLHYEAKHGDILYIKSSVDNDRYLVRNMPDKKKAANLLATIKDKCKKLTDYLSDVDPDNKAVQRLILKFNPNNISESQKGSKHTSYSVNKGEKIVFCLRQKDQAQQLVRENLIMFVALHELAHIMTKTIGHTDEFWDNFKFLLKHALKMGIYKEEDFKNKPQKYCGTEITDSPLDNEQ